jgi:hypothetical protein
MVKGTFYIRHDPTPLRVVAETIEVIHNFEGDLRRIKIGKQEGYRATHINPADVTAYWIEE